MTANEIATISRTLTGVVTHITIAAETESHDGTVLCQQDALKKTAEILLAIAGCLGDHAIELATVQGVLILEKTE